jgi:hypothetical protein
MTTIVQLWQRVMGRVPPPVPHDSQPMPATIEVATKSHDAAGELVDAITRTMEALRDRGERQ